MTRNPAKLATDATASATSRKLITTKNTTTTLSTSSATNMDENNQPKAPAWTTLKDDIQRAGGAWPPPGTREVQRAVAVKPPRDHAHMTAMLLKRRKLVSAVNNGRTLCRAEVREQLMELEKRINAYAAETHDT